MKNIKDSRQPIHRNDQREWNTTIFWGTQLTSTKIINIRTKNDTNTNIDTYQEYTIANKTLLGEVKSKRNFKSNHSLNSQKAHFFKEIISLNHTI